ncbi:hypothetical protein C8N32_11179 [Rhodovulum imhoffii]|uniref:CAF17 C-terminal domain-containing protein n=1 Tax=Rhodovulum imhoffii TaxID=365340 RepID=A0A2T5BR31_9RHOB|nr:folate-binding protein YgfZ [Rhodovulum imhoffii]MBK5934969.1 folate-binding protein YgfZ [Rhodovulum imhoffii]PTN01680.1 hypothetical protein C8N32_11179 [Rhodovulum imhoffii]
MKGEAAPERIVLEMTGTDRTRFLQGQVSNDVSDCAGRLVYTAMLNPQGKYLADFFVTDLGDKTLIDAHESLAPGVEKRLSLYKLRADVQVRNSGLHVQRGTGPAPEGAFADPRHPELGWRAYTATPGTTPDTDWDAIRVTHCIPESGVELIAMKTFILEAGFERLNGVDFRKGCYVGQEVTARMKHKTERRKGLTTVRIAGEAPPGTEILAEGRMAGTLFTRSGDKAIAFLWFDRAKSPLQAGDATLTWPGDA